MKRKLIILLALGTILSGCSVTGLAGSEEESPYSDKFEAYSVPYGWLLIDKETGCQYLRGPYGESSFTPRLMPDGKPYCGHTKVESTGI
ncbi:hypothetical protein [Paenibacillus polymyxa]|uniref:hypothetical protein n=1 Tax=Paenibacillus polymyxa TaxID=1406 RepID=UPI00129B78D2|nr:hypothetical protein [Paenibacillus polymyxa]KAE8559127.1 hypothetical protein BJH92_16065 [Paenibacillus polymyxa]MCJ1222249.1 hypothetical protein [Paenibacillus polymyxa]